MSRCSTSLHVADSTSWNFFVTSMCIRLKLAFEEFLPSNSYLHQGGLKEATETGIQRAIKWCLKVANSLALQKVCKIDELHWPKSNRKGVNSDTEINQNIEHKPPILCKKDAIITYFAWNNFWVELELWKDREKRERHQNVQKRELEPFESAKKYQESLSNLDPKYAV